MNIKQLKYFLVVAEERQITSAAKKLYIAQPPLSYQLKQLEKEVGVQLFVRTAHGIELTEEGKVFQKYAEKQLYRVLYGFPAGTPPGSPPNSRKD